MVAGLSRRPGPHGQEDEEREVGVGHALAIFLDHEERPQPQTTTKWAGHRGAKGATADIHDKQRGQSTGQSRKESSEENVEAAGRFPQHGGAPVGKRRFVESNLAVVMGDYPVAAVDHLSRHRGDPPLVGTGDILTPQEGEKLQEGEEE